MTEAYRRAVAEFEAKRIEDALATLDSLFATEPDHVDGRYLEGVCHFRRKRFEEARASFSRLLDIDNGSANGRYYLGLCYERLGEAGKAEVEFKLTLALDPAHALAREKLGSTTVPSDPGAGAPLPESGRATSSGGEDVSSDPGALLFDGHRKVRTLLPSHLLAGAVLAVLSARFIGGFVPWMIAAVGLVVLVAAWVRSRATTCRIYERRVDLRRGLLFRREHSIWTYEIEAVDFTRGPMALLMGTGKVKLEARGRTISLYGFGGVAFMRHLWEELRDAALVERRGMKKWWI